MATSETILDLATGLGLESVFSSNPTLCNERYRMVEHQGALPDDVLSGARIAPLCAASEDSIPLAVAEERLEVLRQKHRLLGMPELLRMLAKPALIPKKWTTGISHRLLVCFDGSRIDSVVQPVLDWGGFAWHYRGQVIASTRRSFDLVAYV